MHFSTKELELNKVLKIVASTTKSDTANDVLTNLIPTSNMDNVCNILNETMDLVNHISKLGDLPIINDYDVAELIKPLDKGYVISINDIMQVRLLLAMERDIRNAFKEAKKLNVKYSVLDEAINNLANHSSILTLIDDTFDSYGVVYDNASLELAKVRKKIAVKVKEQEDKVRSLLDKYRTYLSESVIVTRNGRYCLPIQVAYKNKIKGTIHDVSQTKQTVYIEPDVILSISSELEYLKILESDEIQKIVAIVSNVIATSAQTILRNIDIFVYLDVTQAKAKYALLIDAYKPQINNQGKINLVAARHPLIEKTICVPIDITLNSNYPTIVITGPNTGGKTVALKTVGLISLMTQCGLLVPVKEESEVAIFDSIFADIGDEQSIEQSLSTFSSHLIKIKHIIDNAKSTDLVLLDEVGSGTDPQEGASLATAILDELRSKKLRLIATTHYSELKVYAYEHSDVMSASVAFDKKSLKPLYYLELGMAGASNAFLIAERLKLKQGVIDEAKKYLAGRQTDLSLLLNKLNEEKLVLRNKEKELSTIIIETEKLRESLNAEKDSFNKKKDSIIEKIESEYEGKWEKQIKEVTDLLANLRNKDSISLSEAAIIKNDLKKHDKSTPSIDDEVLNVGDQVFIRTYQKYGVITSLKKDDYEVSFGDFKMKFSRDELSKHNAVLKEQPKSTSHKRETSSDIVSRDAKLELDLRGFRYEDVKDALLMAIDRAIVSNLSTLHIIHGFGTGAVKKAVYEVLKNCPNVVATRYGGENEGLNGVTIITIE